MPPTKPSPAHARRASAPPSTSAALLENAALPNQEQNELGCHVWGATDILRGAGDCKHAIFGLLLYKRLCDVWEEEYEASLAKYQDEALARAPNEHRFHIPEGCLWTDVRRRSRDIGTALNINFRVIESSNPRLEGIFECVDFADKARFPDDLMKRLLSHFERFRLRRADVHVRTLRDACEYLIERFADAARLKHRDRPTPKGVAQLLVALSQPDEGMTVYDPVCGSAGLLLETARHLERAGKDPKSLALFGQDQAHFTWAICRMSIVLQEVENASIEHGDTLSAPRFLVPAFLPFSSKRALRRFDRVLANPPFSLSPWGYDGWSQGDPLKRDVHGCPPRAYGDLAFVLHMLASLEDGGRMAVVVPYGVLYRSGREAQIRESLLQCDLLEAVVGLGQNLFNGTSVPVAVLIFQRDKRRERQKRVLIVNGEEEHVRGPKLNMLSDQNVARLVNAVQRFDDEPGFCRVVTLGELSRNEFNLSITLYMQAESSPERDNTGAQRVQLQLPMAEPEVAATGMDLPREARHARSTLAALDEAIRTAHATLDQARQIRDARSCDLLTPGLGEASYDHPQFSTIPSKWKTVLLGDLLEVGPLNGIYKNKSAIGKGVLFIGQTCLSLDGIVTSEHARRLNVDAIERMRFGLRPGDILMRRVHATKEKCGRSALVTDLPEPAVCESSIIRLRTNLAKMDPLILLHWIHHPVARRYLASKAWGTVQVSINHKALQELPCPLISDRHERQNIVNELLALDEAVRAAAHKLVQLTKVRDELSPHVSRGKVRRTPSTARKGSASAGSA